MAYTPVQQWRSRQRAGAEIVVNGHDHTYERMAPARPNGKLDRRYGIRQFVAGTGGANLRHVRRFNAPRSRVYEPSTFGVLRLRLRRRGYSWRFIPIPGMTFTDSGRGRCHGKPGT